MFHGLSYSLGKHHTSGREAPP